MDPIAWRYVGRTPELHRDARTATFARRVTWTVRIFAAFLIVSVLVSLVHVKVGILLILVVPILFVANCVWDHLHSSDASAE